MNVPLTETSAWDFHLLTEPQTNEIKRRFPGVIVWFGGTTRQWWAVIDAAGVRPYLVWRDSPQDLCRAIASAAGIGLAAPQPEAVKDSVRPVVMAPCDDRPHGRRRAPGRHERKPK